MGLLFKYARTLTDDTILCAAILWGSRGGARGGGRRRQIFVDVGANIGQYVNSSPHPIWAYYVNLLGH